MKYEKTRGTISCVLFHLLLEENNLLNEWFEYLKRK
jgi:hypothetical protein